MLANHSQEWEFDLQLFAGEDADPEDVANDEATPAEEGDDEDDSAEDEGDEVKDADEEFDEIVYNKETVRIPKKERTTYLQKGYNYDKVQTKAKEYESALQRAAKLSGFENVDAYLKAVDEAEKKEAAKEYASQNSMSEEAARRLLDVEQKLQEREKAEAAINRRRQVDEQKATLKDKPYFTELQSEIDETVEGLLADGHAVDVEAIYHYLRGKNLEDLMSKKVSQKEKQVIANVHDQARRGLVTSTDGEGDEVDVSDVDIEMAQAFGNDPKEIAKYVKRKTKK